MYKRASQIWQRLSKSRKLVKLLGKKRQNSEKISERAKKAQAKKDRKIKAERKAKAKVNCKICGEIFRNYVISEHMFLFHKLSTCKFCSEFMKGNLLHEHIRSEHGEKKYLKWLNSKSKGVKPNTLSGELVSCEKCNQTVDSNLMTLHQRIYCKK